MLNLKRHPQKNHRCFPTDRFNSTMCNENRITQLVCNDNRITQLVCNENRITQLVCNDNRITQLVCNENRITQLVCNDNRITQLVCNDNRITQLVRLHFSENLVYYRKVYCTKKPVEYPKVYTHDYICKWNTCTEKI
jgi:Leucine-rich repeat (LRR) protein